ncbi:MAG: hypothetical protein AAGH89_12350 [Verrucomicrobiota bacterium]
MATTHVAPQNGVCWWWLPSWLGLDSPFVITTWTVAVSRTLGTPLGWEVYAAQFFACWSVYLADRLIDVRRCRDWSRVNGRLEFGRRVQRLLRVFLGFNGIVLAGLLISGTVSEVAVRGLAVAFGVLGYGLLFVVPVIFREKLPGKEFGIGLFSVLGIWAAFGSEPGLWPLLPGVALVVMMNCFVIAARDREIDQANDPGGASLWWKQMDRQLPIFGILGAAASGAMVVIGDEPRFFFALLLAFVGLVVLHRGANRISADSVRAVADLCLLTPWLTVLFALG